MISDGEARRMFSNEEYRRSIEKYQKEHPLPFGTMMDVTAISSKEGADLISQTIERISKKMEEDTELWCICEMAKMYMQGVRPVYPVRPIMEWIPITYRPMTEEEVKKVETYFGLPLDEKDKKCFSCPMPEHGQEILISTKWGVSKDMCLYDSDEGYSLDGRGYWEDVDAWMPLPERYEVRGDDHED